MANDDSAEIEKLPLSKSAEFLLEECRMVLPGIQALFGFQLIAVFNPSFSRELSQPEQILHLAAIGLVAIAVALIMTPAAFHRQTDPEQVSRKFILLSTRLLLFSMPPLCVGICIDFYLIAKIILSDGLIPLLLSAGLLGFFVVLWFVLSHIQTLR
jgi:hypothetical protein